jgi:hypothetical protein
MTRVGPGVQRGGNLELQATAIGSGTGGVR